MEDLKEQWNQAPIWQKAVILSAFTALVVGGIWFYVVSPIHSKKQELVDERDQLIKNIKLYSTRYNEETLKKLESRLEKLKEEEKRKSAILERVVGKIPSVGDIDKIFRKINDIALAEGLVIQSLSVKNPEALNFVTVKKGDKIYIKRAQETTDSEKSKSGKKENKSQTITIHAIPVTLTVEGKTSSLYRFMHRIQKGGFASFPTDVVVESLDGKGRVKANISMYILIKM